MGRRFLLISLLAATTVSAYPSFIGYRQGSCVMCHANPVGTAVLTDYGRALLGGEISAKPPWSPNASDLELAAASGFVGRAELPNWIRPQARYVGRFDMVGVESGAVNSGSSPRVEMDLVVRPWRWLFLSANGAYATPAETGYASPRKFVSREHYLAVRPARGWGVYGGLLAMPFGLRTSYDQTFARANTGVADVRGHGVLLHQGGDRYDWMGYVSWGDLQKLAANRTKAASTTFEMESAENVRWGLSAGYLRTDFWNRYLGAVHARFGIDDGASILFEVGGFRSRVFPSETREPTELYLLIQSSTRFARGYHFLMTSEAGAPQLRGTVDRRFRIAPGLQSFLFTRLELRAELRATRIYGPSVNDTDEVDLNGELRWLF